MSVHKIYCWYVRFSYQLTPFEKDSYDENEEKDHIEASFSFYTLNKSGKTIYEEALQVLKDEFEDFHSEFSIKELSQNNSATFVCNLDVISEEEKESEEESQGAELEI